MVLQAIVGLVFVASGVVLAASPRGLALRMLHHVRGAKFTDPSYARMPAWLLRSGGVLFIVVGIGALTFLR